MGGKRDEDSSEVLLCNEKVICENTVGACTKKSQRQDRSRGRIDGSNLIWTEKRKVEIPETKEKSGCN